MCHKGCTYQALWTPLLQWQLLAQVKYFLRYNPSAPEPIAMSVYNLNKAPIEVVNAEGKH